MKKLVICFCVLILVLCLSGCGGGNKGVDLNDLAQDLLDSGAFSDVMSPMAEGVPAMTYGFDAAEVEECVMYYGTGATAEEIFLAKTTGAEAAARLQDLCQTRIQNQQAAFANYVPAEMPKLQSAVIGTAGSYVVLIVSNDPGTCQSIVEKSMN